jgi:hypothetical protein
LPRLSLFRSSGASASITFTGSAFAWVPAYGPNSGKAKVYVDGALAATVDLTSDVPDTWTFHRPGFTKSWATSAKHMGKIVVVGTLGRPRVDIDSFALASADDVARRRHPTARACLGGGRDAAGCRDGWAAAALADAIRARL